VVTQKGAPSLTGWPSPFDHVFGDARLRDLEPELEQFAVNTRWPSSLPLQDGSEGSTFIFRTA
jgi:hypothetical protein